MKLITIIGARPQFVKAAPISIEISKTEKLSEEILHTGQHYDEKMSDIFFDEMSIPSPTHNLGIGGGTHGMNTGRMLEGIEKILLSTRPNGVLVYGDTDSTLAAAIAAAKLHIPIFHVEAGLRSYNRNMPEEINRYITDHLSTICFAPTKSAIDNLKKEGINNSKIISTNDVMADSARIFSDISDARSKILNNLGISININILK